MRWLLRMLPSSLAGQSRFVVVFLLALGILVTAAGLVGAQQVETAMDRSDQAEHLRVALDSVVRSVGEIILTEGSKSSRDMAAKAKIETDKGVNAIKDSWPELSGVAESWRKLSVDVGALLAIKRPGVEDEATMLIYGRLSGSVADIQNKATAAAEAAVLEARKTVRNVIVGLLVAIALLVAVAGLSGVGLLRQIRRRLGGEPKAVVEALQSVVAGDLSSQIEVPTNAPRSVAAEVAKMQDSLRNIVGSIRGSAEEIASAASEIASGNLDLSGRTEQTAVSLERTASSVEQMSRSVQGAAKTAARAASEAADASAIAARSGSDVSEVVATMMRIDGASKRIADIIGVIDSIAFQTNILALNAAVEAARAGEQGRGFAVVASEVRSLAQRSAQAAREIKQLIGSSVEEVGHGMVKVQAAGQTVGDLVSRVDRVTHMIGEISEAAAEESRGIELLTRTVGDLEKMTLQNSALVEQAAASATSLSSLADQLVITVSDFRLDAAEARQYAAKQSSVS